MAFINDVTNALSGGNNAEALRTLQGTRREYDEIQTPELAKMRLHLEKLVQQGQLDPKQAELFLQESSAMQNVKSDPALREAQMRALAGLQDVSEQGGLTATDKARLGEISQQEMAQQRGQREAILQNARQRGIAGSGLELASQLNNQQASATRQSQQGLNVAAMAQQRALDALMQSGQLGGNIRSQDFEQDARKAAAQDAINAFNTANRTQNSQYNTGVLNNSQAANLAAKQAIANQNVGIGNQQQQFNNGLYQQDFNNQMAKQNARAGVAGNIAGQYGSQGQQAANLVGTAIKTGGALATGGASLRAQAAANGAYNGPLVQTSIGQPIYGTALTEYDEYGRKKGV
jgi:hypothetical protein